VLSTTPEHEIAALLRCWALRISDLKKDVRFKYVTVFRNRGELAGQQIGHPHSELTATTFIPRRILYELRASSEYFQMKELCVLCDIQQQEERQGLRVVELTPKFLAVCPFATRVPFELWILPRYHTSSFEADVLRHPDQSELAGILRRSLARLEQITSQYHLVLHTTPNTRGKSEVQGYWTTIDEDYHWHIEILPITQTKSKSYSIKEVYYCPLLPEEAAKQLRDLPTSHDWHAQSRFQFQSC
jgi:UDPglucose--hexose-1-phosphate uridylyltransferase